MSEDVLGTWSIDETVEASYYSLRLVVDEGLPQQAEDRTVIWIDPEFMNGWPQTIPDKGAEPRIPASQLVADLNNDAANELIAHSFCLRHGGYQTFAHPNRWPSP